MQYYDFNNRRWSETPRFVTEPVLIAIDEEFTMYVRPSIKMSLQRTKMAVPVQCIVIMLSMPNNYS